MGNPGADYDGTRHNLGFDLVRRVAHHLGLSFRQSGPARIASGIRAVAPGPEGSCPGVEVLLVEPLTWMNLSGKVLHDVPEIATAVAAGAELLTAYDDLDLPTGRLRVRTKGSDGGHRGMRSLQAVLGERALPRLRIGCGPVPESEEAIDFVLARPGPEDRAQLDRAIDRAGRALLLWFDSGSLVDLMNELNPVPKDEDRSGRSVGESRGSSEAEVPEGP